MAAEQLGLRDYNSQDIHLHRRPSRGMYVSPSLFTAGNCPRLLRNDAERAGFGGRTSLLRSCGYGHRLCSASATVLDGLVARVTHTASDFGKELDSPADVITFGVAPSMLAYIWGFRMLPSQPPIPACARTLSTPVYSSVSCSRLRCQPPGALQYQLQHQSAAAQPR